MEKYKQRMISELIELHLRYCAAANALFNPDISADDRELLNLQALQMARYEQVLRIRMQKAGINLQAVDGFMQFGSGVILK